MSLAIGLKLANEFRDKLMSGIIKQLAEMKTVHICPAPNSSVGWYIITFEDGTSDRYFIKTRNKPLVSGKYEVHSYNNTLAIHISESEIAELTFNVE